MTLHILTFGIAKEIFDAPHFDVEVKDVFCVRELKETLEERFPRLRQLACYRIALNNEFAYDTQAVQVHDEVAIIPPVSGG